ncbi:conserved exported hypothetical protein [Candidatus Sulfotelmatobacter kueseliae]|uniref:DUF4836 family protein n=1 Tax=Candidatus Sulfotelmatobacter kueseliae TaxID=2042962 RepID=A0A2U3KS03_9BACT|nr:conserved exported hypothetical protein [Candidatus Sulfotelmatobacter kueseliae]
MKLFKICVASLLLVSMAYAMPLNSSARSCIPAELMQLISVDYRALKDSPTALALKKQLMPDNIKQFEAALKGIGIDPDKDVDTLAFASFRSGKQGVKNIGAASGSFDMKVVLKKMKLQKFVPRKYGTSDVYPMDGGFVMTFLDNNTLLFGESTALHAALDTRDGKTLSLDTNGDMADMMPDVDSAPVWSILDQQGTQNMMRSALGDASRIADYETLKKRLLGSRYTMNFSSGVNFDLTVLTSDSVTASTLSSLVKAGILYKKMNATAAEKVAVDNTTVDSDSSNLQLHFKSTDQQFESLMHSDLFAAVSH